ncbi:hypothetical protein B0H11DRAFT_808902 [Mycena galericulata]|nr:hypothetical protein B0H11DRAFT_808902 [Mycena galericulata]
MSFYHIPDEILAEILSPLLEVPDAVFSDTKEKPLLAPGYSSSTYLLVCKAWLRVATPLLYRTVVFRTTAQVHALNRVLRANKEFGLWIRKLRVEGGFGPMMLPVLTNAPNVTDLFLTLAIWGSDNVAGLCQGLRLINPRRVILADYEHEHGTALAKRNKQVTGLVETLLELIPKWDKLTIIDLPFVADSREVSPHPWGQPPPPPRCELFFSSLERSRTLRTFNIYVCNNIPKYLYRLENFPSLTVVRIKVTHRETLKNVVAHHEETLDGDPNLGMRVKYELLLEGEDEVDTDEKAKDERPNIALPSNPLFTPMASIPQNTRDAIWLRILFFAIAPHYPTSSATISLACVSKTFRRLALPLLYHAPSLEANNARLFARALSSNLALGAFVRALRIPGCEPSISDNVMQAILPHCSGLRTFGNALRACDDPSEPSFAEDAADGPGIISYPTLETLGVAAGATLSELGVAPQMFPVAATARPIVLSHFTALKWLVWASLGKFDASPALVKPLATQTLGNLQALRIDVGSPSFLGVLTRLDLPSLQQVVLSKRIDVPSAVSFLRQHGAKLTELRAPLDIIVKLDVYNTCTNLSSLVYLVPLPSVKVERRTLPETFLSCDIPHTRLVKIRFQFPGLPYKFERQHEAAFKVAFEALDKSMFPALQELQLTYTKWPTSEHEIPKNKWVQFSKQLEENNVRLTDEDGVGWTARSKK